jgi:hypothetical protein
MILTENRPRRVRDPQPSLDWGRRRTRRSRDERIRREGMHQARVRHQMAVRIPQLDVLQYAGVRHPERTMLVRTCLGTCRVLSTGFAGTAMP